MWMLLALACNGPDNDKTGGTGLTDTAPEDDCHPMFREYGLDDSYCYLWVHSCENSRDAQAYILGEATTDAQGNFTATETWFWLTDDDGPDDDDGYDVLEFTGTPMTRAAMDALEASQSEEGYDTIRNVQSKQTDINYGSNENILYIFDTLNPEGQLNWENNMLVFRYRESNQGGWRADTDYAEGKFYPDSDDNLAPPATYTWEGKRCY